MRPNDKRQPYWVGTCNPKIRDPSILFRSIDPSIEAYFDQKSFRCLFRCGFDGNPHTPQKDAALMFLVQFNIHQRPMIDDETPRREPTLSCPIHLIFFPKKATILTHTDARHISIIMSKNFERQVLARFLIN